MCVVIVDSSIELILDTHEADLLLMVYMACLICNFSNAIDVGCLVEVVYGLNGEG